MEGKTAGAVARATSANAPAVAPGAGRRLSTADVSGAVAEGLAAVRGRREATVASGADAAEVRWAEAAGLEVGGQGLFAPAGAPGARRAVLLLAGGPRQPLQVIAGHGSGSRACMPE
eukprot:CAMPEP_0204600670 /NCGR_PEP_ID=MMETSP0661-20131031/55579_1 /ASSEMBLY_ACC=CAM_ASM_000606 /TAXON_ID=109239 /ORGANISM="Alexandrium margalefi, Strain AMGDE01CS-322" /LENGTH=116 /DNA_ID=CAMNT_0051611489 /DNA_START=86 /DNA_END=432 /DNA_ORIENTATION=+